MDPTANLNEQQRLAARIQKCHDRAIPGPCAACAADGARLAELVIALDEWISNGCFLPLPWERMQSRRR